MQTAFTVVVVCIGVFLCCVVVIVALTRLPLLHRWSVVGQRRLNEALQEEIRLAMPFLFTDFRGVFLAPDERKYPAVFDYAVAIVGIDTIVLRFIRGRSQFSADISYQQEESSWFDLLEVIAVLSPDEIISPPEADTWRVADPLKRLLPALMDESTRHLISLRCQSRN